MTISVLNSLGQPIGAPVEGLFPRPRPPRTPIEGRLCAVVPVDPDAHAMPLFEAMSRDSEGRNWTYLPYGPFESAEAFAAWMRRTCLGEDPLFHTILDAAGRPVGLASYLRIDPANGVIEVGHIHYSPLLQRTLSGSEAMFLMMRRVFDELGYRRYEWKCNALNEASKSAALRLGFSYEGTFRQAAVVKGHNRDTAWFAMIDADWPAVRAAFEDYLSPANIDAEGRQRRQLAARRP